MPRLTKKMIKEDVTRQEKMRQDRWVMLHLKNSPYIECLFCSEITVIEPFSERCPKCNNMLVTELEMVKMRKEVENEN